MDLRIASTNDIPFIREIYNSTIPGRNATADTTPVSDEIIAQWLDKRSESRPLWIIIQDDKSIGWALLKDFYGRPAYAGTAEISMYLHSDYRGKGIGSKALRLIIGKAAALGIHSLLGFIFAHNQRSIRLLKAEGFENWGTLPGVAEMDGEFFSLLILGKKIINQGQNNQ